MLNKRWVLKKQGDAEVIRYLMENVKVSEHIANLLAQRNIDTFDKAKSFFRPSLEELHDPFLMKDMDKAVDRILSAINNNEKILLYGDYDVDGTTAVAILYLFLKKFTSNLDYYIPDRYKEGYGISEQGIDYASNNGCSLVVALDCGIKACEAMQYAKSKNIEFIICDHHISGDTIPEAIAVLDPKRKDCSYPFDELSGCGVGFKFIQGIALKKNIPIKDLIPLLDKVALSIASDIVPVNGENRILAYYGLERINTNPCAGIEAVMKTASIFRRPDSILKTSYIFTKKITISDLVFVIGPRVNASGRIQSGRSSVDLLVSDTADKADNIAKQISYFNDERKSLDSNATIQALDQIDRNKYTTVLYDPEWSKGILGIVASRLTEHHYRPTIVLTKSSDTGLITGSARSIREFDIYEAIESCSDLLEHWGGHTFAAGLSLKEENLDKFKKRFEEFATSKITDDMKDPIIEIDANLDFKDITNKFYNILCQFAPFGPLNMAPVFQTKNIYDNGYSKLVGADSNHIKLMVTQPSFKGVGISAIAFQMGEYFSEIEKTKPFDIAYTIEENEWNGNKTIQLNVKDLKLKNTKQ